MKTMALMLTIFLTNTHIGNIPKQIWRTTVFTQFPNFLCGTWKVENHDMFEHWDYVKEGYLKGLSYTIKDGRILVSEYLEIQQNENVVVYAATVLNQNQGKTIHFLLQDNDSLFSFENPTHDFPKKIQYKVRSDSEIAVTISDGGKKSFSYIMKKIGKGNR